MGEGCGMMEFILRSGQLNQFKLISCVCSHPLLVRFHIQLPSVGEIISFYLIIVVCHM